MVDITTFAEFLQTYGGWGISVVLIAGIIYQYRVTHNLIEDRTQQLIDMLKETSAMLQQSADESRHVQQVLERVERLLERVEKTLESWKNGK